MKVEPDSVRLSVRETRDTEGVADFICCTQQGLPVYKSREHNPSVTSFWDSDVLLGWFTEVPILNQKTEPQE